MCSYCTQDHTNIRRASMDKFDTFLRNNPLIDRSMCYVSGGEVTEMSNLSEWIEFLLDRFDRITITTNLQKLIVFDDQYVNRINLIVSYNRSNDKVNKTLLANAIYLNRIGHKVIVSVALTQEHIYDLYDIVNICDLDNDVMVKLEPIYSKNDDRHLIDEVKLTEVLKRIYNSTSRAILVEFNDSQSRYRESCINTRVTYGWDDNVYGCYTSSDMFMNFNGEFKLGDYNHILTENDRLSLYDSISNEIVSYDGTKCVDCGLCKHICKLHMLRSGDHIGYNECTLQRVINKVKQTDKYKLLIENMTIFLTEQCNMRCKYCFEEDKPINSTLMSKEVLFKSFDLLRNNKCRDSENTDCGAQIFGGEPTLHIKAFHWMIEYIETYYDEFKANPFIIKVATNALHLSDELLECYKKLHSLIGRYLIIATSMDGFKELHDKFRIDINGNGTFDRVINNLKTLRAAIPRITIYANCVLSEENMKHTKNIYYFLESLCTDNTINNFDMTLVTEDTTQLPESHENLEYTINACLEILDEFGDNQYIQARIPFVLLRDEPTNTRITHCDAGEHMISITPDGKVQFCHRYITEPDKDKYSIGNILDFENDIEISVNDPNYDKYVRKTWREKVRNYEGVDCNNCPLNRLCHICIGGNELMSDDISINSYNKCERTTRIAEAFAKCKTAFELEKQNKLLKEIHRNTDLTLKGQICLTEVLIGDDDENHSCDVD